MKRFLSMFNPENPKSKVTEEMVEATVNTPRETIHYLRNILAMTEYWRVPAYQGNNANSLLGKIKDLISTHDASVTKELTDFGIDTPAHCMPINYNVRDGIDTQNKNRFLLDNIIKAIRETATEAQKNHPIIRAICLAQNSLIEISREVDAIKADISTLEASSSDKGALICSFIKAINLEESYWEQQSEKDKGIIKELNAALAGDNGFVGLQAKCAQIRTRNTTMVGTPYTDFSVMTQISVGDEVKNILTAIQEKKPELLETLYIRICLETGKYSVAETQTNTNTNTNSNSTPTMKPLTHS